MTSKYMGKKQLLINLLANIISFTTALLISFFLTPYLISTIGKEAYGFYPMANNFVSYLMIITLALNSMASRFITIELVRKNYEKSKIYFSSVFYSNILMALILFIPMGIIISFIDYFLNIPVGLTPDIRLLFSFIFLSMIITIITSVFGVATFAKNRLELRAGAEIIIGLLKIVLFAFLFAQFKPSIVFVGLVMLILSIINLLLQILFTKKLLPNFKISLGYFDLSAVKELLKSGIWNSLNSLGSLLLLGISLLLANVFIGASASGEIAIVQTIPHLIISIISMVFAVFMPRITHVYAKSDKSTLAKEIIFSQKVMSLFTTMPIVLLMLFGFEFFSLWIPSENAARLQFMSIIVLAPLIVHGNMWTVFGSNIVLNKIKVPSLVLIVAGIINILLTVLVLNFINSSVFTILIISTSINIAYYSCFIPLYAAKEMGIKKYTFQIQIAKSLLFSALFFTIGSFVKKSITIDNWFGFFIWVGLFGLIGLIFNLFILLNRNEFIKLRKIIIQRVFKNNI